MTTDPRSLAPELVDGARARARASLGEAPERLVVVSVGGQRLWLVEGGEVRAAFPVSTAARGVGSAEGSLCTPPGTHRIARKIGDGQPLGAVFASREPTGEIWRGAPVDDDLILTRVLTLTGCEPGINQGPGCDSHARTIYIHGTNHEDRIGAPASHGCVRMTNRDVRELFELVREGDVVVVV